MREELKDLDKVVKILKKHKIHFWMYGGALAGYVKINDLFPWDGDIDLFVWQEDYKKLMSIKNEFGMKYVIKGICLALRSEKGKNIDIMPFDRDEEKKVARFERIDTNGKKLSKMIYFGPLQWFLKLEKYKTAHFFWLLSELFGGSRILQEVPLEYFENLKEIDFFGIKLKVPKDHEKFMDYTFGEYWRKPVEEQEKNYVRENKCNPYYHQNLTKKNGWWFK